MMILDFMVNDDEYGSANNQENYQKYRKYNK